MVFGNETLLNRWFGSVSDHTAHFSEVYVSSICRTTESALQTIWYWALDISKGPDEVQIQQVHL